MFSPFYCLHYSNFQNIALNITATDMIYIHSIFLFDFLYIFFIYNIIIMSCMFILIILLFLQ